MRDFNVATENGEKSLTFCLFFHYQKETQSGFFILTKASI